MSQTVHILHSQNQHSTWIYWSTLKDWPEKSNLRTSCVPCNNRIQTLQVNEQPNHRLVWTDGSQTLVFTSASSVRAGTLYTDGVKVEASITVCNKSTKDIQQMLAAATKLSKKTAMLKLKLQTFLALIYIKTVCVLN